MVIDMLKVCKKNLSDILDYFLVILLFFLAIKKGGFYKTDILLFSILVQVIGCVKIVCNFIKNKENRKKDVIGVLLLILSFSYLLPVVFNNYSSLNDSFVEFIRYFNLYIIYKLVSLSNNKEIFKSTIIYLATFLGVIGIDGLANRFLENGLKVFSSGYLNIDLTRMSSTLQYANVLAIILLIASVFSFDELNRAINENSKKNIIINYTLTFFNLLCLILTKSRTVVVIAIIYYIMSFIKKENRLEKIYVMMLLTIKLTIFSILVLKCMYINTIYIYYLVIISLIISMILAIFIYFINVNRDSKLSTIVYSKYNIVISGICILSIFYILLGICIETPLKITESSKDTVKRYVYNVEKGDNTLEFFVKSNIEDSRYKINIYKTLKDNKKELIKTFEYYNNVSGNFNLEFYLDSDIRNIELEFDCYKGSIIVENAKLNERKIVLDYLLLPTDIINKFIDVIYGSDSAISRSVYLKDAIKILKRTGKNMLIGVGGEGFNNTYQLVQEQSYTSTEVHNSFVQILVESGIIGFICIISVIIYYLVNYKNNIYKYLFLLLIIHSIFDLNFSYMIGLVIFAILLGINEKKKCELKENSLIYYLESIAFLCIFVFSLVLLLKMNIAYSIKVPLIKENITFSKQAMIVNCYEKKVNLDLSENKYRKRLAKEYEKYLKMLNENLEKDYKNIKLINERNNIIYNIEQNAISMQENEKEIKEILIDVSNIYFNNIVYLVNMNYNENEEEGYNFYLEKITKNLEYIEYNYKYNAIAKELLKESYLKYYEELKSSNINNNVIKEFLKYFESKIYC